MNSVPTEQPRNIARRIFRSFVSGNFFIALCAVAMVYTTFLLNRMPLRITPFSVFIASATFLLYNYHRLSFRLEYSSFSSFIKSAGKLKPGVCEKVSYLMAGIIAGAAAITMNAVVYLWLLPLAVASLLYSTPLIRLKGGRVRLLQVFFIKTPLLAVVWSLLTVIIPLAEQGKELMDRFVLLQVTGRALFIFSLCIPFEMRDEIIDRKNGVSTLAVAHGRGWAKSIGVMVIVAEIITHYLMDPVPVSWQYTLDLTSVFALILIFMQNSDRTWYFYKFIVDGTMVLRFVTLLIVAR